MNTLTSGEHYYPETTKWQLFTVW